MFRRLMTLPVLILGITLLCFGVIHLAPGDPTQLMGDLDPRMQASEAMKAAYNPDTPLWQQYMNWLGNLAQGDLGTSLAPGARPVLDKILDALPVTLALNLSGLFLVLLFSLPLAVAAARAPQKLADTTLTILTFLLAAAPGFWIALLFQDAFAVRLGWFPLAGLTSDTAAGAGWLGTVTDMMHHLALPLTVGVLGSLAGLTRFLRGSLIETLRADYVLTAKAKGASPVRVWRHALRNALLPVITILGLSLPGLIGGSVILESIFALPGMGQLFFNAAMMRDYPTIMGILTFGAVLTLLGNMLADMALALADPRVRG
ncbi:MAG: diguanylate cyclase [Alphaproteobacteria bacterium CG_4_10_14_0_8_um_filter_53_9]|nr:MAG: diguanylate cyclase [Alphaproteobacteria bacterium CG_4_10_14_0_8_um_filter_53_9]